MIKPVHIVLEKAANTINEAGLSTWLNPVKKSNLGYPAPVVSMLEDLNNRRMVVNES
jgi:hypothetical protein